MAPKKVTGKGTEGSLLQASKILYTSCPAYLQRQYLMYVHLQQILKLKVLKIFFVALSFHFIYIYVYIHIYKSINIFTISLNISRCGRSWVSVWNCSRFYIKFENVRKV